LKPFKSNKTQIMDFHVGDGSKGKNPKVEMMY